MPETEVNSNEGLSKLTEYLNQTRRQAAASIDMLNQRIYELENGSNFRQDEFDTIKAEVIS